MQQNGWQQVLDTLASEFSDLPDAAQTTRALLRLTLAALLGGLLGMEREQKGKAAGVRTQMLVAMGAALFVLLSQQAGMPGADQSCVIQGIIAGIGFLGAGTIFKGNDEDKVKALKLPFVAGFAACCAQSQGFRPQSPTNTLN